jgi:uridine kinase
VNKGEERMSEIRVTFTNNLTGNTHSVSCPYGVIADTLLPGLGINENETAALRVNNEIRPLKTHLAVNSVLEPVPLDSREGAMIYRRSLSFLLAVAERKLFPDRSLHVGHSLGNSYYYTFSSGEPSTEEDAAAWRAEMNSLVDQDLPINFKYLAYEEALEVFEKNRQADTVLLLDQRGTSRIKVNECNGYGDIYIEPLVPRTGMLSAFEIMPYKEGVVRRFPAGGGRTIRSLADEPKIFKE